MNIADVLECAANAVSVLKKNPLPLLASVLVDVFALIAFGYLSAPVYSKLTENIIIIGTMVSQKLPARGQSVVAALSETDTLVFVNQLFLLLILLLAIAYVIFVVSQGVNFSIAKYALKRKTSVTAQTLSIMRIAALWSIMVAVFYAINMLAAIRQVAVNKYSPGLGLVEVLKGIEIFLLLVAVVHLASGSIKGVKWIVKEKIPFLASMALMMTVFGVISAILQLLGNFRPEFMLFGGLFVFFPALAWLRIFYVKLVSDDLHS